MEIKVLASLEDPWCHRATGPGGGFGAGLELLVQGGQGLSQALEPPVPSPPPESRGHHPHVTSGGDEGTGDNSGFFRPVGSPRSEQQEELWASLETKSDSSYKWATKSVRATEGLGQTPGTWLSPRRKIVLLVVRHCQSRGEQDSGRGPWSHCPVVTVFLLPLSARTRTSCSSPELLGLGCFPRLPRPLSTFESLQWGLGPRGLPWFLQHWNTGVWSGLMSRGSGPPPSPYPLRATSLPWKPQEPSPELCLEPLPVSRSFCPFMSLGKS